MSSSNPISLILSIVWSDIAVSNQRSTIFEQSFTDIQEADLDDWALTETQQRFISHPRRAWCPCVPLIRQYGYGPIARDVSTIGYRDINLEYDMELYGTAECHVDYSIDDFPNGPWSTLKTHDVPGFFIDQEIVLPADAANVDSLGIKFYISTLNYCMIKNIKLTGIQEPPPQQNAPAKLADPIAAESESQPASNQAAAETDKGEEFSSPTPSIANVSQSESQSQSQSASQTEEVEEESIMDKMLDLPWVPMILLFAVALCILIFLLFCCWKLAVLAFKRVWSGRFQRCGSCINCGHTEYQCRCQAFCVERTDRVESRKHSKCLSPHQPRSCSHRVTGCKMQNQSSDEWTIDPQWNCGVSPCDSFERHRVDRDISTSEVGTEHWLSKVRKYREDQKGSADVLG